MSVYVAGPSSELERCAKAIASLRAIGITVTHDWTEVIRTAGDERFLDRDALAIHFANDISGATSADLLWVLVPSPNTITVGAWIELGTAIGLASKGHRSPAIVVSCNGKESPAFVSAYALMSFPSDAEAVIWISGWHSGYDRRVRRADQLWCGLHDLLAALGKDDLPRAEAIRAAVKLLVRTGGLPSEAVQRMAEE